MAAPETINPKIATITNQNGMNLPFLEAASFWSNIAVVALTVLAAIAGVFALYFSSRLGALKDADFEKFRLDSTTKIVTANSEAAKANSRAAEANQKAEEEKLARIKIEQRLADRVLTDAQVANIAGKIKSFTGQEYRVVTYWDLREPLSLANRIHESLIMAGWKYIEPEHGETLIGGTAGVLVYVHPEATEQAQASAASLVDTLVAEQIEAELRHKDTASSPDNMLGINVGVKP